jgi:Tfp pilus assembly protein PilF
MIVRKYAFLCEWVASWWRLVSLVAVLCLGGAGCGDEAQKAAAHQERARAFIEKGEWENAEIELKNVLQLDSWNDDAHYLLGRVYR